jgi:hypothetical protein
MMILFFAIAGFLLATMISEIALRGTELQTGLSRVILVHAIVATTLLVYFAAKGGAGIVALIVFWSGAFLTWFGVRSHFESSILLRLLFLLRKGAVPEQRLLADYESHYGEAERLQELFRGNLVEQSAAGIAVTSKGKMILRIVSILK